MKSSVRALALFGLTVTLFSGCGILGSRRCNDCNGCNGPIGCRPCPVGWQRGGTDYGAHLSGGHCMGGQCGPMSGVGNGALRGRLAGGGGAGGGIAGHMAGHNNYMHDTQVGSGVPAPQTAYPYYTVRGPRDFFANNPPSIGR
jgi:hypothetical protein